MSSNHKGPNPVSRRSFLKTTVAKGTAGIAVAAAGLHAKEAEAANIKWDRSADVVVVGAGVSGLACACAASDTGAAPGNSVRSGAGGCRRPFHSLLDLFARR